jgi:DNA-binding NarL/FixJ family response regulator
LAKLRILLADDHRRVMEAALKLLRPAFDVVGVVGNGQALVEAATELKPDVVITDISMPVLNGIEAVRLLNDSGCGSRFIFLTVHNEIDFVRACLAAGALGFVIKSRISSDLLHAVREALAGRVFISRPLARKN